MSGNITWRRIGAVSLSAFTIMALPILVDQSVARFRWWLAFAGWTLASIVIAIGFVKIFPWFLGRRLTVRQAQLNTEYDRPGGTLVFTFGPLNDQRRGDEPSLIDKALAYARPKRLVLLHTDEGRVQADNVGVRHPQVDVRLVNISAVRVDPEPIIEGLGLHNENDPAKLLFDITGGTKAMTVSAYLAATELNADACYVSQTEGKFELFRRLPTDGDTAP